jgi:hypothetical protein
MMSRGLCRLPCLLHLSDPEHPGRRRFELGHVDFGRQKASLVCHGNAELLAPVD